MVNYFSLIYSHECIFLSALCPAVLTLMSWIRCTTGVKYSERATYPQYAAPHSTTCIHRSPAHYLYACTAISKISETSEGDNAKGLLKVSTVTHMRSPATLAYSCRPRSLRAVAPFGFQPLYPTDVMC